MKIWMNVLVALLPASASMAEPLVMAKRPVSAESASKRSLPVLLRAYRHQRARGEDVAPFSPMSALREDNLKNWATLSEKFSSRTKALQAWEDSKAAVERYREPARFNSYYYQTYFDGAVAARDAAHVAYGAADREYVAAVQKADASVKAIDEQARDPLHVQALALRERSAVNRAAIEPALSRKLDELVVQRSAATRRLLETPNFDSEAVSRHAVELIHAIDELATAREPATVLVAHGSSSANADYHASASAHGFNFGVDGIGFDDKASSATYDAKSTSSWQRAELLPQASHYSLDTEKKGPVESRVAAALVLDVATTIRALAARDPAAARPFMQWYDHSVFRFATSNGDADVQIARAETDLANVNRKSPDLLSSRMVSAMKGDVSRRSERLLK